MRYQKQSKSYKQKVEWCLPGALGEEKKKPLFNGYRVSDSEDKMLWKSISQQWEYTQYH